MLEQCPWRLGDGAEQLRILHPSNCTADAVRAAAVCWKEPSYHSCTRNLLSGFLAVEEGGWKASPIMGLPREVLAIFPDGSLPYSKRNRGWKVPVGTFPSCSAQALAFPRVSPRSSGRPRCRDWRLARRALGGVVWTLVVAAQRGVAVPCAASEFRQWIWAGGVPELALGSPGTTGLQGLEVSGGHGGSCRKLSRGAGATRRACGVRARTGLGHE